MNVPVGTPKWDLGTMYAHPAEDGLLADLDKARHMAETYCYRCRAMGPLTLSNETELLSLLKGYEAIMETCARPLAYARLLWIEDRTDSHAQALLKAVEEIYEEIREKILPICMRVASSLPPEPSRQALGKELRQYKQFLDHLYQFFRFAAREDQQKLINTRRRSRRAAASAYETLVSTLSFEIKWRNQVLKVTAEQALSALYGPEPSLRRKAYKGFLEALGQNSQAFHDMLTTIIQSRLEEDAQRQIDQPCDTFFIANCIERSHVRAFMDEVGHAYPLAQRYLQLKARAAGKERLDLYSIYAPVLPVQEIPFYLAKQWILEALGRLHHRFYEEALKCFEQRRIHALPSAAKDPGARCIAQAPSIPPYITINYNGRLRDVLLLAHELGHAIHYSLASSQSYLTYLPLDLVSEAVALFFENAVARSLVHNPPDQINEIDIVAAMLDSAFVTLFRQHSIVWFEDHIYQIARNEMITCEKTCDIWLKSQSELFGNSTELAPEYRWAWAHIPHLFLKPFYCYSYVYGYLAACAILGEMEGRAKVSEDLIQALQMGRNCRPLDLLAVAGAQPAVGGTWSPAIRYIDGLVKRFGELIEVIPSFRLQS